MSIVTFAESSVIILLLGFLFLFFLGFVCIIINAILDIIKEFKSFKK